MRIATSTEPYRQLSILMRVANGSANQVTPPPPRAPFIAVLTVLSRSRIRDLRYQIIQFTTVILSEAEGSAVVFLPCPNTAHDENDEHLNPRAMKMNSEQTRPIAVLCNRARLQGKGTGFSPYINIPEIRKGFSL